MRKCVLAWIVASAVSINSFSFIHSVQAANKDTTVESVELESILEEKKIDSQLTRNIPASDKSSITFEKEEIFVGEPIKVTLELRDDNDLPVMGIIPTITVGSDILPLLDEDIKELGEGKYEFLFTPTQAGVDVMGVNVYNIPIKNKFFSVKDIDGVITVSKAGSNINTAMLGDEIEITLELTKKEGANPQNIKVIVPGVEGHVVLKCGTDGIYRETVKLGKIEAGYIIVNDVNYPNIKQVPFSVTEQTGGTGNGEIGTGEAGTGGGTNTDGEKPEEVIPTKPVGTIIVRKDGQPVSDILAKDEIEIVVELKSTEPLPEELKVTVPGVEGDVILKRDSADGLYKGNAIPTKPIIGHITINDSRYEHQPVQITVYVGEISTENSNFAFEADSLTVGENISGKLRLQDKNGNGVANKQPRITFDGSEVESKEVEEEVGTYAFSITPQSEGEKELRAEVDGKEVLKYTIQVIPPSFPNRGNHSIPLIESIDNPLEDGKENAVETEKGEKADQKTEKIDEIEEKQGTSITSHKTQKGQNKEKEHNKKVVSIAKETTGAQFKEKENNVYLIGKEENNDKDNGEQESCDTGIVFGNYFVSPTSSITSTIPKTDDYTSPKTFLILLSSMMVMVFQVRRKKQR